MTQEDKNTILDQLSVNILKAASCQMLAEENNLPDQAQALQRLKNQLKGAFDKLAEEAFQNWIGEAETIRKDLAASHHALEGIIQEIEQQQNILENIVKAIGKVEEVIQKVRTILPTF